MWRITLIMLWWDQPAVASRWGCPRRRCPPGSPGSGSPTAEARLDTSLHRWTWWWLPQLQVEQKQLVCSWLHCWQHWWRLTFTIVSWIWCDRDGEAGGLIWKNYTHVYRQSHSASTHSFLHIYGWTDSNYTSFKINPLIQAATFTRTELCWSLESVSSTLT